MYAIRSYYGFSLVRLRENAESVALYRGNDEEGKLLTGRFGSVVDNFFRLMKRQKLLGFFTSGYSQIAIIFPFVVSAPSYFAKQIQLVITSYSIHYTKLYDFTASFSKLLTPWVPAANLPQVSFVLSFLTVTSLFILLADLIPKRLAMMLPEEIAIRVVRPMRLCLLV